MYFEVFGEGKPVVYLHGWGCDGSIFFPIVKQLDSYANYVLDLPGFGKSDPPPENGFAVADYAEHVREFLLEHGMSNVTIVAHSFGCRVALVLAARYPELVDRMLFFAPAALRRFSLSRWCKVRVYKLGKLLAKLRRVEPHARYASEDYVSCSAAMRATFVKVVNEDLSRYAKRVRCQVLIVNGTSDTATPLSHAKRLSKLVENCSLVEIEGDHFALFYAPVAFANTVKSFVE